MTPPIGGGSTNKARSIAQNNAYNYAYIYTHQQAIIRLTYIIDPPFLSKSLAPQTLISSRPLFYSVFFFFFFKPPCTLFPFYPNLFSHVQPMHLLRKQLTHKTK